MKKILVIDEVDIISEDKLTRNTGFNIILNHYTSFFDEVHYLAPSRLNNIIENGKCFFHPFKGYNKKIYKRLLFLISFPAYRIKIKKMIMEINPDIIQIRIPALFPLIVYKMIKNASIPITSYIAGEWDTSFYFNYKNIPFGKIASKYLFLTQADIIKNTIPVTAGSKLTERFSDINICHSYFSTTHSSINARAIRHPAYKLLTVGRLENLKRVEDAILALKMLLDTFDKFSLTIVGDGKIFDYLKNMVKVLNLENHVVFMGYISNERELNKIYLDHDILLHPSVSEGSPKVLAEAMSNGLLPVAVKNVGSINSIITHSVNGFLCEPQNPESIYTIISNYNKMDKSLAINIIENSYIYAKAHTIDLELKKMWDFVFYRIKHA
jgi:glycosyltransferase involved in cell wall biosynthesis